MRLLFSFIALAYIDDIGDHTHTRASNDEVAKIIYRKKTTRYDNVH